MKINSLQKFWPYVVLSLCFYLAFERFQVREDLGNIFLVRHADRIDGEDALSVLGLERALDLAQLLQESDITTIYSSDYNRTKSTARALASDLGLTLEIYDAGDLPSLVTTLRQTHHNDNVLVVGHSNTTPDLVNLLGHSPALEHIDHDEYDKLYQVMLLDGEYKKMIEMDYGEPSPSL